MSKSMFGNDEKYRAPYVEACVTLASDRVPYDPLFPVILNVSCG